jgi:hypothetical protein
MSMPKAYDPQHGYKYQILVLCPGQREYEHCDYAKDNEEKRYLIGEYRLSYGAGFSFKSILLPRKYWNEVDDNDTEEDDEENTE